MSDTNWMAPLIGASVQPGMLIIAAPPGCSRAASRCETSAITRTSSRSAIVATGDS
jgi:hypothetical protein